MDPLTELADKYGTTKGSKVHLYTPYYHSLLKDRRETTLKVLEIGIENFKSHRMWQDYFPNAKVYGMDFVPKRSQFGVEVFIGNQGNREHLAAMMDKFGGDFDLIVDDGGHQMVAQQTSFGFLFPFLKHGGLYIIEDLFTCFWGSVGGVKPDGSNSTILFLEKLQKGIVDSGYITTPEEMFIKRYIGIVDINRRKDKMMVDGGKPYDTHITASISQSF